MEGHAREPSFDELERLSRVPLDDALDALGDVRRRRVLFELLAHDRETVSADSLADSVEEESTGDHRVEMHHVHLPKLAGYGFVDWDRETHEVTRGIDFNEIEPLLSLLADNETELPDAWL